MTDATARYTSFRIALASGLLGAAGASLGWLVWLTVRVANPELIGTVLAGASLGLAVHWVQHYVRVARREREGAPPAQPKSPQPPAMRRRVALMWAAGFGFLGLVTEHLIADMAAEFLQPFLASIAALFPAGMILGYTMSRGREEPHLWGVFLYGLGVGIAIALVTGLIWAAGFGTAPWRPLIAWWGLIGLGSRLVVRRERHAVRIWDPLLAVALVFGGTFVIHKLPFTPLSFRNLGPWQGVPAMIVMMATDVHDSPALPATFWQAAEQRFIDKQAGEACPVPIWMRPAAPVAQATHDSTPPAVVGDPLQIAIDRAARLPDTTEAVAASEVPQQGAKTEFLRSWLVILLFAAGIGLAPWLERALRPIDYPNSETYRRDITLTVVVALMLVGACVFARIDQRNAAAREEACAMQRIKREYPVR